MSRIIATLIVLVLIIFTILFVVKDEKPEPQPIVEKYERTMTDEELLEGMRKLIELLKDEK
jgi:hypothetical protein